MERAGIEQPPVELRVFIPLLDLPQLAAHEQQLPAGEQPLVTEQRAKVRKFLPVVAGHPRDERAFAVNHFVVRQRQHKIFVVMIEHREREIILVIFAMHRFAPASYGTALPQALPARFGRRVLASAQTA